LKSPKISLAAGVLAATLLLPSNAFADPDQTQKQTEQQQSNDAKCHWWSLHCDEQHPQVEGLPDDAPREGTLITVDVSKNKLYLFKDGQLVDQSPAATGKEKVLKKAGRTFFFHTPRGRMKVLRKIVDPVWTKPDWAFIEDGKPVPPIDSPKRKVEGHLGKYALDLGDGIMIHGTDEIDSLGRKASHGCIRLPGDMLEEVYHAAEIGTPVYIYESQLPTQTASKDGKAEHHSDLDMQ
jgi:lipoprotein-anchoring transpeptidase ErfK/SrfK